MEENKEIAKIEKTESLTDIAQGELLEVLAEEFLPKLRKFLPMILKKLKDSEDLLKPNEMGVIYRGTDNEIYFARTKVDMVEVHDENPEIYKIETLFTDALTKNFSKK